MLKAIMLAATLAVSALGATSAQSATVISVPLDDDTGGFFSSVKGAFSYDYTFTIPSAGQVTASLTSSAVTFPIVFTSVKLNGVSLIKDPLSNSYSLPTAIAAIAGPQIFHVAGNAPNPKAKTTFSGTLQFITAVPEPAAWMMMVVGFGALGATMRRRPAAGAIVHA